MTAERNFKIVADGPERARQGIRERVAPEVEAKYAEELKRQTNFWGRRRVRRKIAREVEQRVEEEAAHKAPPDALY